MGKWTRRGLITAGIMAGGVFAVGVAIRPGHRAPRLASMVAKDGESLLNIWVKLAPDNTVTAIVPHSEMGQGVFTSMTQMLADEMDADWNKVRFEQAPAHEDYANFALAREYMAGDVKVPGFVQDTLNGAFLKISQSMSMQITGGSTAVRFTGKGMRIAGAAAKEMIVKAASTAWDVPISELRTAKSMVIHERSSKSAPYAEFAEAAAQLSPPTQPKLKSIDEYTYMGKSQKRFDIPSKVDGTGEFGIDVDLPGMKYAAVMGPPVLGSKVKNVDDTAAKSMRGVIKVIKEDDFVAVVASSYWHAEQAVAALNVSWTKSSADKLSSADIYADYRNNLDAVMEGGKSTKHVSVGNAREKAESAAKVVEVEYQVPFLAHAAMEPINATAWIQGDKVDFWSGLQNPLSARDAIADFLAINPHNVEIHNVLLGGGFGRRGSADYPLMAIRIAKHFDTPVKMIWSREQDTTQDFYRPSAVSRFTAGVDETGMPVSWENLFVHRLDPGEASHVLYDIPDQYIHYISNDTHVRHGPWRSVDHTQHGFFIESFIDELAHGAGMDGYKFRRKLLASRPRFQKVLDAAAKDAGWGRTLPAGHGLGIAITESFGTIVAEVAEVDMTDGTPTVTNVWCAADPGFVVNPDGFTAQIESGIIYGLTAALYGDITIEDGAVVQSNFHDYPMVRMYDAPKISVTLINSGARVGGGGEPGTPPIAPAVANAIFSATGKRHRVLPFSNEEGVAEVMVSSLAE